jgi:hypothetical protein
VKFVATIITLRVLEKVLDTFDVKGFETSFDGALLKDSVDRADSVDHMKPLRFVCHRNN